jgi:transposase-like protein
VYIHQITVPNGENYLGHIDQIVVSNSENSQILQILDVRTQVLEIIIAETDNTINQLMDILELNARKELRLKSFWLI